MKQVNVMEFRRHPFRYLKQVSEGEEMKVTSRGKAIVYLSPEEDEVEEARKRLFALWGKGLVGNVISPVEEVQWTGDEDNL